MKIIRGKLEGLANLSVLCKIFTEIELYKKTILHYYEKQK